MLCVEKTASRKRFQLCAAGEARVLRAPLGGTCDQSQITVNTLNRIADTGYSYDAAGNLTAEPGRTYQYDAENRLVSINGGAGASYVYDTDGKRVQKVAGGVATHRLYAGVLGNRLYLSGRAACGAVQQLDDVLRAQRSPGLHAGGHEDG